MLRAGALSTQALARRLRLLALEVFFLGTAMSGRLPVLPVSRDQSGRRWRHTGLKGLSTLLDRWPRPATRHAGGGAWPRPPGAVLAAPAWGGAWPRPPAA